MINNSYQGHVDIAGVQLQVDLLIDEGLAVLLVVLSDPGHHPEGLYSLWSSSSVAR